MVSRMRRCVAALQNAAGSSSSFGLAPLQAHGARNNVNAAEILEEKNRTDHALHKPNKLTCYLQQP
jgi:hypothetical protein